MHSLPGTTEARDFPRLYEDLLWKLLRRGAVETNERTGKAIKAYPTGPVSFSLDLSSGILPVTGNRKLFPATAAAETAWYVSGLQDATLMMRHARVVWEKFLEPWPDGGEGPFVRNAYGHRWRRHFGRDQLELAVQALRRNPTDRRVWISAWDPSQDGLGAAGQLNVPCPVGFTFSIQEGRLNSAYLLRSSDVFVGLPYDVMGHAMLMACVANSLGVGLGCMHFTLAHPHIYDVHWAMAEESLAGGLTFSDVPLLVGGGWDLDYVQGHSEDFIKAYKNLGLEARWPEYHCRPEVVQ